MSTTPKEQAAAMLGTVIKFRHAADQLEKAVANLRDEAGWLERNYPLSEWSADTAASYLKSSEAGREYEIRQATSRVLAMFDLPAELVRAVSRGMVG